MSFSFHGPPSALVTKGSRGPMSPFMSAGFSANNAQAGENRGVIAAHKYEGLTNFQRTSPRSRTDCGDAAAGGIINLGDEIWRSGMSQKKRTKGTISWWKADLR